MQNATAALDSVDRSLRRHDFNRISNVLDRSASCTDAYTAMMAVTLMTKTVTCYFDVRFTGPTSGPEGIRVGPLPARAGIFRAKTHDNSDNDDDNGDDDDGDVAAADTNTSSITLTLYWNVRVFFSLHLLA